MSIQLRIKSKSLADEARHIRREELRLRGHARSRRTHQLPCSVIERTCTSLYLHRIHDVRYEARATFLARAYLAGRTRAAVEIQPVNDLRLIAKVFHMVSKYSSEPPDRDTIEAWLAE